MLYARFVCGSFRFKMHFKAKLREGLKERRNLPFQTCLSGYRPLKAADIDGHKSSSEMKIILFEQV